VPLCGLQASSKGGAGGGGGGGLELDSPECFYALLSQPVEAAAANEIDLDDDDETGGGGLSFLLRVPLPVGWVGWGVIGGVGLVSLESSTCGWQLWRLTWTETMKQGGVAGAGDCCCSILLRVCGCCACVGKGGGGAGG